MNILRTAWEWLVAHIILDCKIEYTDYEEME